MGSSAYSLERGMSQTVLVLGATGGIGGEVARQLREASWHVRGLTRRLPASGNDGIEWNSTRRRAAHGTRAANQRVSVVADDACLAQYDAA